MTTSPSPDAQRLAETFRQHQDINADRALVIASKVLTASQDVAAAALQWSRSGTMPTAPVVAGHTPAQLSQDYLPTQVFTILATLAEDPNAAHMLTRYPKLNSAQRHDQNHRY